MFQQYLSKQGYIGCAAIRRYLALQSLVLFAPLVLRLAVSMRYRGWPRIGQEMLSRLSSTHVARAAAVSMRSEFTVKDRSLLGSLRLEVGRSFLCSAFCGESHVPAERMNSLLDKKDPAGQGGSDNHEHELSKPLIQFLDSLKNFEKQGVPEGAGTESKHGFDLDPMRRLLARLNDPHHQYPIVHIAGTKGKGSTVTFISSILRAAGFSVGTYTSPHLLSIRERIVSGRTAEPISEASFGKLFEDTRDTLHEAVAFESGALTHFEVLTALAFTHFAREKVDVAVIEVGLGGARDATNVVPPAGLAASVIVSIGEEHMAALGGCLENIALAKAGIIKEGRPVIVGHQPHRVAEETIYSVAARKQSSVIKAFGPDVAHSVKDVVFEHEDTFQICDLTVNLEGQSEYLSGTRKHFSSTDLRLRLLGVQQLDNAVTSVCAALVLRSQGWNIPDHSIKAGLETAHMPGRFQVLTRKEAEQLGCAGFTIVLDGAHTAESAAALANTLQAVPKEHLSLVVAMASDKDHAGFASAFLSGSRRKPQLVITTQTLVAGSEKRSASASLLAEIWARAAERAGVSLSVLSSSGSVASAIRAACEASAGQGIICVTGSLHAVASALSLLSSRRSAERSTELRNSIGSS